MYSRTCILYYYTCTLYWYWSYIDCTIYWFHIITPVSYIDTVCDPMDFILLRLYLILIVFYIEFILLRLYLIVILCLRLWWVLCVSYIMMTTTCILVCLFTCMKCENDLHIWLIVTIEFSDVTRKVERYSNAVNSLKKVEIFKSQRPSIFPIQTHCRADFWEFLSKSSWRGGRSR